MTSLTHSWHFMVDTLFSSAIFEVIKRRFPKEVGSEGVFALIGIWSEVLEHIIGRSQEEFYNQVEVLHIDLKPELAVSLVNTVHGLAGDIVAARTANTQLLNINPSAEREFHSSEAGRSLINGTAHVISRVWLDRYQQRWEPKSKKKLERENKPPETKPRQIKAVRDNHYIAKFTLRDYWSSDGEILIHERVGQNEWRSKIRPFSQWGFKRDLYSARLEDRFSLIEGDAQKPIEKILNIYPLNDPERLAFWAF